MFENFNNYGEKKFDNFYSIEFLIIKSVIFMLNGYFMFIVIVVSVIIINELYKY